MKTTRLMLLAIVAFAFTVIPADVKLEYTFKVGDEYTWIQNTKQKIKQSVMGMEQTTETLYDGEFSMKITSLTPTGAKMEARFTRLKSSVNSLMGQVTMDSDGDGGTMENKVFKSMMNKPFHLTINKKGEIENIEGAENLLSGINDLGLDENAAAAMKQSMEQLLGKNSLKGSFEQAFVVYPDKKIKQGDTWKVKHGAPLNFPLETDNTWVLNSLSGSVASLTADGVYSTTNKDQIMNLPQGMKAKTDLSGKQVMKTKVDVKTGWPTTLEVLSELKGKMILLAGGMIPEDMDIPMEILTESSFKIVKK